MSKLWPNQPTVSVFEASKFQTVVISVAPLFELKWIFTSNAIFSLSWHYVNTLLNWWKFVRYVLLGTNFKNIIPPLCYEPTERILMTKPNIQQKMLYQWICCKCLKVNMPKYIQPPTSKKMRPFFIFLGRIFDLKISQFSLKVFIPTSKI